MSEDIFALKIYGTTELASQYPLTNVAVRASFVDIGTRLRIKKKDAERKCISQYEETIYIPTVCTRGLELHKTNSLLSHYNETFVFNEPVSSIQKNEAVLLLEVIDMTIHPKQKRFIPICWAYLKIKNEHGTNFDKKSVLQCYSYPKDFDTTFKSEEVATASLIENKIKYAATITINLQKYQEHQVSEVNSRPHNVFEKENGKITFENLINGVVDGDMSESSKTASEIKLQSHKCQIPKKLVHQISPGEYGALCLKFNRSGTILAAAIQIDDHFVIRFFNSSTMSMVLSLPAHIDIIYEIEFSHSDKYMLSASADGMVKIWPTSGQKKPEAVLPHSNHVYSAKFHPNDSSIVATAGFDGIVYIWNVKTQKIINQFKENRSRINSIVFSPNGNQLFAGDASGGISIFNTNIKEHKPESFEFVKYVKEPEIQGSCITHLDMGKSNLSLLVHTQDGLVRNFETKVMVPSQRYVGAACSKYKMESYFSPDSVYVIAGSENGSINLWTVRGSEPVHVFEWNKKFNAPVTCLSWNPKQDMVAFSSFAAGQSILVYSAVTQRGLPQRPIPHTRLVPRRPIRKSKEPSQAQQPAQQQQAQISDPHSEILQKSHHHKKHQSGKSDVQVPEAKPEPKQKSESSESESSSKSKSKSESQPEPAPKSETKESESKSISKSKSKSKSKVASEPKQESSKSSDSEKVEVAQSSENDYNPNSESSSSSDY